MELKADNVTHSRRDLRRGEIQPRLADEDAVSCLGRCGVEEEDTGGQENGQSTRDLHHDGIVLGERDWLRRECVLGEMRV